MEFRPFQGIFREQLFKKTSGEIWMTTAPLVNMRTGGPFDAERKMRPVLIIGSHPRGTRQLVIPGSASNGPGRYKKMVYPAQYPFLSKPGVFICDQMQYQLDEELSHPIGLISMQDMEEIIALADAAIQH